MAKEAEEHAKEIAKQLYNAERDRDVTLERMDELEDILNSESYNQSGNDDKSAAVAELEMLKHSYDKLMSNAMSYQISYDKAYRRQKELQEIAERLTREMSDANRAAYDYKVAYQKTLDDARFFERGMEKSNKLLQLLEMCTTVEDEIKHLSGILNIYGTPVTCHTCM